MHWLSNEYKKEPENKKSPASKEHFFISRCYLNHYCVPTAVLIVNFSPIDSVRIVPTKWVSRNLADFSTIGTNWDAFFEIPLSSIFFFLNRIFFTQVSFGIILLNSTSNGSFVGLRSSILFSAFVYFWSVSYSRSFRQKCQLNV